MSGSYSYSYELSNYSSTTVITIMNHCDDSGILPSALAVPQGSTPQDCMYSEQIELGYDYILLSWISRILQERPK